MNTKDEMTADVFVTVYRPVGGWKAVCIDREMGPIQTGFFCYANKEDAIVEAKSWARDEEIPYVDPA